MQCDIMPLSKKFHKHAPMVTGERKNLPPLKETTHARKPTVFRAVLGILSNGRAYSSNELYDILSFIKDLNTDIWLPLQIDVALQHLCTKRKVRVIRVSQVTYYALK